MQNALRIATATEVQNNFGKYLQYAVENGEVVILRNGKREMCIRDRPCDLAMGDAMSRISSIV